MIQLHKQLIITIFAILNNYHMILSLILNYCLP